MYQTISMPSVISTFPNILLILMEVQWQCKTKLMKFYDKEAEVKARNGTPEITDLAKGILRFEAEIRSRSGQLLQNTSKFRLAGELLHEDVAKKFLIYHLDKLKLDRQLTVSNKLEVFRGYMTLMALALLKN